MSPTSLLKPNVFVSKGEDVFSNGNESSYVVKEAYTDVLKYALYVFGVSRHHLAGLLGCEPAMVYRWLGRGQRRPSSKYMVRLLKLHELNSRGVPLAMIRRLDWKTGEADRIPLAASETPRHLVTAVRRREWKP